MTSEIRSRMRFAVSPRFEIFYALQVFLDPASRIHAEWKRRLAGRFGETVPPELAAPELWALVSDALAGRAMETPFDELLAELRRTPLEAFVHSILEGALHSDAIGEKLGRGRMNLGQAVARVPRAKREWLAHIGLYPFEAERPIAAGLDALVRRPARFRDAVVDILGQFWSRGFRETWAGLEPACRRSLEEKQRLFEACTLGEFARHALLRVEVDETKGLLRAVRGGYTLPLARMTTGWILPSAFNDKRWWHAYPDRGGTVAVFPYFDPTLAPEGAAAEPELDPALLFKALGDTTRFAIASLLAREPRTSARLADLLAVSRPTVSHHVQALRAAGLLREEAVEGGVRLHLRRDVVESISALAVRRLFESRRTLSLKTTRSSS